MTDANEIIGDWTARIEWTDTQGDKRFVRVSGRDTARAAFDDVHAFAARRAMVNWFTAKITIEPLAILGKSK